MRKAAKFGFGLALAAALGVVCFSQKAPQTASPQDVTVIVNAKNTAGSLTLAELTKIYRGERQYWKTNLPIVLLFRNGGSYEREVFLRTVFQMTEAQYKQYWVSKVMRAEVTAPPTELFSSGMTKEGVTTIPGAIGCISASDIRTGMKVLRIDGHLPGEPGYPLH
jgi:ABC-type phosphate transport system substrate-binding protein